VPERVSDEWSLREEVVATARALSSRGLTSGRSGNVSARSGDRFVITPSGVRYEELRAGLIVPMAMDGSWPREGAVPSSEWRLHRALYAARPEIRAVVHAHSREATALACHGREIPAFHYMVAVAGGANIPCAPYATYGSEELAGYTAQALRDRNACLLAHHGSVAVAGTLGDALQLAEDVEWLAAQYCAARALGEVPLLSPDEMERVLGQFRTYGQPRRA